MMTYEWVRVITYLNTNALHVHKMYSKKDGWIRLSYKNLRTNITEFNEYQYCLETINRFINYHK
jgi:hypothetical protein